MATTFDSEAVLRFLQNRWSGHACPVCGKGPWNVNNQLFQLLEFHEGAVVIGGSVVPVIPVTCGNCGNTVLVNAIIAGAVKPQLQPSNTPASDPEKTSEGGRK